MVPWSPQPERHRLHSSSYIWCPANHNLKDTDYTVAAIYGALVHHNLKDTDYTVAAIYGALLPQPERHRLHSSSYIWCPGHHNLKDQ